MNTITRILAEVHEKLRSCDDGTVADYIPELSTVDPELFGISLTTPDGHTHAVGDSDASFTIQSVSKAFVYGLVLDAAGAEARFAWLGDRMRAFAGRPLDFDQDVYESERDTGHRNRAIAYLLRAVTASVTSSTGTRSPRSPSPTRPSAPHSFVTFS